MSNTRDNLKEFFRVVGVKTAIIVGRDGLVLEGVSNEASTEVETVGALLSHALLSTDRTGEDLKVGRLKQGIEEYEDGVLVTSALGQEALLCLMCETGVNLGMVRFQIRKCEPAILSSI